MLVLVLQLVLLCLVLMRLTPINLIEKGLFLVRPPRAVHSSTPLQRPSSTSPATTSANCSARHHPSTGHPIARFHGGVDRATDANGGHHASPGPGIDPLGAVDLRRVLALRTLVLRAVFRSVRGVMVMVVVMVVVGVCVGAGGVSFPPAVVRGRGCRHLKRKKQKK